MEKKKIAIVSSCKMPLPPVKGGAVETLIDVVVTKNEQAHKLDLDIYSVLDLEARKISDTYCHTRFDYISIKWLEDKLFSLLYRVLNKICHYKLNYRDLYVEKVIKRLKEKKYDYVVIEGQFQYVPILHKKVKVPIVLHLHSDSIYYNNANSEEIVQKANKIIAVSPYIQKRVLSCATANESEVCVLDNCIDYEMFDKDKYQTFREEFRKANGIAEDAIIFTFCGRICEIKGALELLQAFSNVVSSNCYLMFIGSSEFYGSAKTEYIKELEKASETIRKNVLFTGYVNHGEVAKYYAVGDVCVIPSICEEAAPLVLFEAMATGMPIIASKSGGIIDYVGPGCHLVSKDGNITMALEYWMKYFLDNIDDIEIAGRQNREFVKKYSQERFYEGFVQFLYE